MPKGMQRSWRRQGEGEGGVTGRLSVRSVICIRSSSQFLQQALFNSTDELSSTMVPAMDNALTSVLHASWQATATSALLLGIAAHLSIRPFEIDDQGWNFFFAYLTVGSFIMVAYHLLAGIDILGAMWRTSIVLSAFNVGLLGSILVYRAIFHRLRRFPGPFMARLSRFYAMKKAAATNQNNIVIQKLHDQYGDFVRVGKM